MRLALSRGYPRNSPGQHNRLKNCIAPPDRTRPNREEALTLDDRFSHSRFKLAQAYEKKTMIPEAIHHYKTLLDLAPAHHRAKEAAKRLKALRR